MGQRMKTSELLVQLGLPREFLDPGLPKGALSHSQYNSYKICGEAYRIKYVDGRRTPNYAATTRGGSVHAGIEFALRQKMKNGTVPTLEEATQVVSQSFDADAKDVLNWGETPEGKVKDSALTLYKIFHRDALAKINPVAVEKGFAVKVGDVPVIGYIDLVDRQPAVDVSTLPKELQADAPKKEVVVDTKTASSKWSEADVRNDVQLTLYAGVEGTPHVRIDQLVALKKSEPYYIGMPSERTRQDIEVLTEDYNEVATLIKKGIFPKTEIGSWSCNEKHCSFWAECRGRKR